MAETPKIEGVVRIGTRASPLALAQAREVRDRLVAAHGEIFRAAIELVKIRTTGDRMRAGPLAEIGGKGLFTKEIEDALLADRIDFAVHSMKDVPTKIPDGLAIPTLLPREDPRDAFVSIRAPNLDALAPGAVVGTASLRRGAQILHRRPDISVAPLRGNVEMRLKKIESGEADATLLALAGLRRLGLADRATAILETEEMLPAVAQGAIGLECRSDDSRIAALLAPLNDSETAVRITAERALLTALDGSCRTPIAALAEIDGTNGLVLRALIIRPDGSEAIETKRIGGLGDAEAMGADAGAELRGRAGRGFFAEAD